MLVVPGGSACCTVHVDGCVSYCLSLPSSLSDCLQNIELYVHRVSYSCYQAAELLTVGQKEGYRMMVESVHSKVHVRLATQCLDNITYMWNESQRGHVIFGNSRLLRHVTFLPDL